MYRGRFAPSPTGDLHLGSAATALVAWLSARAAGGRLVLRIEDIDVPRVVPGSETRQLEDLRWLGLDWDEGPDVGGEYGPYRQSERSPLYEDALARLAALDLLYRCDCSRADITRAASAPHAGEEGPRYPGTCRSFGPASRTFKRRPSLRLKLPDELVSVDDALQGPIVQDVAAEVGDVVLKRADGIYAYQLACVVDDLAMDVTEVVRGVDLLPSAPRQVVLARLLGHTPPSFAHGPLVVASDGSRLAKRARGMSLREHRERGAAPGDVVAGLARLLGLAPERTPGALLARFDRTRLARRREARLAGTADALELES